MSKTKKNPSISLPRPFTVYESRLSSGELRPDPVQKTAVKALDRLFGELMEAAEREPTNWIQRLTGLGPQNPDTPMGIYMFGGVGRGKSMLMDLFFDCLPDTVAKRRVHFHEFMIEVHNYLHERREDGDFGEGIDGALPSLACRIAESSRILCFDEFHVTDVADAMILGRLFTALFDRDVAVITTSNWEPDRLYEGGLQRDRFLPFIELLKKQMDIVHLDSPTDYRAELLAAEGSYFWPLNEATDKEMDALFEKMTDGSPPLQESFSVKGRQITVTQAAKGFARFSFAELCERPHGAEDYLAIAERYHTVFLERIPKMAYDRRNEAKRLMTLIDALYESNTRLIVSADGSADKLYYGHDHAFEFERTISRLNEMQSEEYLQKNQ